MTFSPWRSFIIVTFYVVISLILFSLTSLGWSGMIILFLGIPVALILIVFYLITTIIRLSRNTTLILFKTRFLLSLFGIQLYLILFNIGDCGDFSGKYFFLEFIFLKLKGASPCEGTVFDWIYLLNPIMYGLFILQLFILLFTAKQLVKSTR